MPQQTEQVKGVGSISGALYVVGTPLGNLEDMTLRAQRVLGEVDLVAAEDTRRTGILLQHLGIHQPMISYYEHNEQSRTAELIERLEQGGKIALVTDAGMPGISDPGFILIRAALDREIPVIPVPGPTAATTALVISGLPTDRYVFEGFLPRMGKERKERLLFLARETRTMILYEAPHRLLRTLDDLHRSLGNRQAAVARELTKLHEECIRGPLSDLIAHFNGHSPRGECVVVVGGVEESAIRTDVCPTDRPDTHDMKELLQQALHAGYSRRDAVQKVTEQTGLPRREVYRASLELGDDR